MNPKEFQEQLAPMFRKQELIRRQARTQIILNHIDLIKDMSEEEKEKFRKALVPIDTRGYWKRLWDAARNHRPFG